MKTITVLDIHSLSYPSPPCAAALQGLVNHGGPLVYLDYGIYDDPDARLSNKVFSMMNSDSASAASCQATRISAILRSIARDTPIGTRFFFAAILVSVFVAALPLLIWYPITRQQHAEQMACNTQLAE